MHVIPSTFVIMVTNLLPLTSASTLYLHLQPGHLYHYRPWPYLGSPTAWLPPSMYYIPKYHSGLAKLSVCFLKMLFINVAGGQINDLLSGKILFSLLPSSHYLHICLRSLKGFFELTGRLPRAVKPALCDASETPEIHRH